tara:strand:- start:1249 stop:1827 length:579 start_codon:yes stop_codon:yes gene_type:complete
MAIKHILSLDIPDSSNCELLPIVDTSQYDSNLGVSCPEISITAPGYTAPKIIETTVLKNSAGVWEGFGRLDLSACALGLQTTSCSSTRTSINDGIYIIKYSVSPNDKAYVEYNHLRTTEILTTYYKKLCELDVTPCEPSSTFKDLMGEMKYIRTLIDAARAKVEYCQSPNEGMELYNFAKAKLKKITCSVCC